MASAIKKSHLIFRAAFKQHRNLAPWQTRLQSETAGYKKTTVTILNDEHPDIVMFDAFSTMGFRLNNGMRIIGPCAAFPKSLLHWNVPHAKNINEDSLSLFTLLEPKIDMLILGIGEKGSKFDPSIIKYLRLKKINVEILPTEQALTTFNFLNSENRYVAGGFIPPLYVETRFDEDAYDTTTSVFGDDMFNIEDPMGYKELDTPEEKEELKQILYEGKQVKQESPVGHRFWEGTVFKLPRNEEAQKRKEMLKSGKDPDRHWE